MKLWKPRRDRESKLWTYLSREHGLTLLESELYDLILTVRKHDRPRFWRIVSVTLSCLCALTGAALLASFVFGVTDPSVSLTAAAIAFVTAGVLFTRP